MQRVRCVSSSLKFAAHAAFGPDLNGGKDRDRVWVNQHSSAPSPCLIPQTLPPAATRSVPQAASLHPAWTQNAAEIVYTLWSLVLLEDSQ